MWRSLFFLALISACQAGSGPDDLVVEGRAFFAKPALGTPMPGESIHVFATIEGTGAYLEPQCALRAPVGRFRGRFDGVAKVDASGRWSLATPRGQVRFTTDGGCPLRDVADAVVDAIWVRGAMRPRVQICEGYGNAKAAAEGSNAVVVRSACLRDGTTAIVAQRRFEVSVGDPPGRLETDLAFHQLERIDGSIVEEELQ